MTIMLNLPANHRAMGAPNPCAIPDAAGAMYFGLNTKINNTAYAFRVYRQVGTGQAAECLSVQGLAGQGQLQLWPDGTLWAVGFDEPGDNQRVQAMQVLEYARYAFSGGAGYTRAPNDAVRVFVRNGVGFDGQETVALTPFGIPLVSALNVRLVVSAPAGGRRGRVGPSTNTAGMLTVECSVPFSRDYETGVVSAGAGNTLVVLADAGALTDVFVDILGWWT